MLIEVRVQSHSHMLVATDQNTVYICDGGKERGTGWRYRCNACDYDMHTFRANASPSIPHPLTAGNLQLLSSPVCRDNVVVLQLLHSDS
ncbi:hypothetical protein SUGI_0671700 [Cryptomeria japonica]|nr:hypothetical protein SUGI_0671700 [Cryptomeria japonica]